MTLYVNLIQPDGTEVYQNEYPDELAHAAMAHAQGWINQGQRATVSATKGAEPATPATEESAEVKALREQNDLLRRALEQVQTDAAHGGTVRPAAADVHGQV